MPPGVTPSFMSWYSGQRRTSIGKRSRRLERNSFAASSVSGNSRAGSNSTRSTCCCERCVSGSKLRIDSTSSSNNSMRYGSAVPIGKMSSSAPRTAKSPGSATCGTWR